MKHIETKFKKYLKARGISGYQLGQKAKCNSNAINSLMNGSRDLKNMQLRSVLRIAKVLGLSVEELVDAVGERTYVIRLCQSGSDVLKAKDVQENLRKAIESVECLIENSDDFNVETDDYVIEEMDGRFDTLEELDAFMAQGRPFDSVEVIPSVIQHLKETDPEGYEALVQRKAAVRNQTIRLAKKRNSGSQE